MVIFVRDGHHRSLISMYKLLRNSHMMDWIPISVEIQIKPSLSGVIPRTQIRDGNIVMNLTKAIQKDCGAIRVPSIEETRMSQEMVTIAKIGQCKLHKFTITSQIFIHSMI